MGQNGVFKKILTSPILKTNILFGTPCIYRMFSILMFNDETFKDPNILAKDLVAKLAFEE